MSISVDRASHLLMTDLILQRRKERLCSNDRRSLIFSYDGSEGARAPEVDGSVLSGESSPPAHCESEEDAAVESAGLFIRGKCARRN